MKYVQHFFVNNKNESFIMPLSGKTTLNIKKFNHLVNLNYLSKEKVGLSSSSYFRFLSFFSESSSSVFFKKIFVSNYSIVSPNHLYRRFKLSTSLGNLLWDSFFNFFFYYNFKAFKSSVQFVFDATRVDRHGYIFRAINKFFKIFPYHSPNTCFARLKIKGKMSRKGIARTKTIYLKKHIKDKGKVFSFKNYYFLVTARTGSTCLLCTIIHNH